MIIKNLLIFIFLVTSGCASTEQLKPVQEPDVNVLKEFGLKPEGKILYEMYQEYGFTDVETQLILVVRPDKKPDFNMQIPVPLGILVNKIDTEKFEKMPAIFRFEHEEQAMADIRNTGFIYKPDTILQFLSHRATYQSIKNTTSEIIKVYDKQNNILYIEAKK